MRSHGRAREHPHRGGQGPARSLALRSRSPSPDPSTRSPAFSTSRWRGKTLESDVDTRAERTITWMDTYTTGAPRSSRGERQEADDADPIGKPRGEAMTRESRSVLTTLVLVALLIISAMVLDVGAVYNQRRQDQNAADSGSLAAAAELTHGESAIVDVAKDYAQETLDPGHTLTADQWNSCSVDSGAARHRRHGSKLHHLQRPTGARPHSRPVLRDHVRQGGWGRRDPARRLRHRRPRLGWSNT